MHYVRATSLCLQTVTPSAEPEGRVLLGSGDKGVALITMDRPAKLNALTSSMVGELAGIVEQVNKDKGVRAVTLTGNGRAFCVGSDIAELERFPNPWEFGARCDYGDVLRSLHKPVIAAVNGYAFGGGLELALACDIRVASRNASFAAPEIKLGWIGGSGQCALLARNVGPGNAAQMLLTGDPIDAETALAWRLVTSLVEPDDLITAAMRLAKTIALRAPIAAQTAKANLRAAWELSLDAAVDYERRLQTICFATKDAVEGRVAFAERRPPHFTGE
jgi:enoyl-CoA hydratase/carnithine racemase